MLPLLITILATAYFIVPDLLQRYVFGFFLVRKVMSSPRSEELFNGVLWSLIPLLLAFWTRNLLCWRMPHGAADVIKQAYLCLSSDTYLNSHQAYFFSGLLKDFWLINACLLGRMYLLIIVAAVTLGFISRNFGYWREKVKGSRKSSWLLHALVLPRISEWHLALSPMLLKNPHEYGIAVDVLTKAGLLYRGAVNEKVIGADGKLQTLLLTGVERFQRPEYDRACQNYLLAVGPPTKEKPSTEAFWRMIPGELFCVVGSEISSINVRHVSTVAASKPALDQDLIKVLADLNGALTKILTPS